MRERVNEREREIERGINRQLSFNPVAFALARSVPLSLSFSLSFFLSLSLSPPPSLPPPILFPPSLMFSVSASFPASFLNKEIKCKRIKMQAEFHVEGSQPEWCISTIYQLSCLRYTILVGNPRAWFCDQIIRRHPVIHDEAEWEICDLLVRIEGRGGDRSRREGGRGFPVD